MRPRKQMSMVEMMIVMAIIGIVAAIVLPSLKQAKERAQAARNAPAQQSVEPDGQLNTIEVSELSETADRGSPDQWGPALAPLFPLAFIAAIIVIIFVAMRRQMSHHAKQ